MIIKQFKDWLLKWSFLFASYRSQELLALKTKHNAEINQLKERHWEQYIKNQEALARYYLDRESDLRDLVEKLSDIDIQKDDKGNYTVTYTINEPRLRGCTHSQVELLADDVAGYISGQVRNYLFSQHNFYDSLKFW